MALAHNKAKSFLLKWYESELSYIRDFHLWERGLIAENDYQDKFRGALDYFSVYCERVGFARLPKVMALTRSWVHGPNPDDVDAFQQLLGRELSKSKPQKETSLASKILFLNHPQKVTPISGEVRDAFGSVQNHYAEYNSRFLKFQRENSGEVIQNLNSIMPQLLEIERKFDDEIPNLEVVRMNRYTDQLLRYKGWDERKRF